MRLPQTFLSHHRRVWFLLVSRKSQRQVPHPFPAIPLKAIAPGYFVASEEITLRTLLGAGLVVGSVVLTMQDK